MSFGMFGRKKTPPHSGLLHLVQSEPKYVAVNIEAAGQSDTSCQTYQHTGCVKHRYDLLKVTQSAFHRSSQSIQSHPGTRRYTTNATGKLKRIDGKTRKSDERCYSEGNFKAGPPEYYARVLNPLAPEFSFKF
jgi:hypothetical protein